ncbi:uncharacterized protein EI90DRAFT_3294613 [Cantharellus anzutake]|uniref:uncharacterized protein n=1 Tax=Cantharellus anzutake TaxID=1750568 RepID=UPI00190474C6|nr:uncharacterized protein EI90DRAFT_3294613 [Cantharellus anzutake]KAF8313019.1 hypothetical protein EI90DRAFT_3294613 [Cantharellus anzutake]
MLWEPFVRGAIVYIEATHTFDMFEQFFDSFRGTQNPFIFGEDLSMANPTVRRPSPDTNQLTHGSLVSLLPNYEDIVIPEQSECPPTLWDLYTEITLPYNNAGGSRLLPLRALSVEASAGSWDYRHGTCGPLSMFSSPSGTSPNPTRGIQSEYAGEDPDVEGEPNPWYGLSCSAPAPGLPQPSSQGTRVGSCRCSDSNPPIPSSSSTPDNTPNSPSSDFSDLPFIPRALYAYGVKRDAKAKKAIGISTNDRRPCPLCSDNFHKSRSASSSKENDWWRHLQQVHLKNDTISYIAKNQRIDIVALLFFATLRVRFEERHDEQWLEPTREEHDEITAFYSMYGEDRTAGPIISTIEEGKGSYPRLMARLESFIPSWCGHFICPSCEAPIGRDRAKDRHPPGHCNGRGGALPPPEFTPWPLHPMAPDEQTAKRPRPSPNPDGDDCTPRRKKPCKRNRGN